MRLEDVEAFAGHLVVHQRSEGLTQLRILTLDPAPDGGSGIDDDHLIEFDQEIYTVGSSGNPDFHAPVIRLGYTSLSVPASVYDYDVAARDLRLLRRTPVLGGYDPADYEERRLWATAEDGERVPISFVCRRGATEDGPIPVLLYGYGAYEISMDPYFSIARLSLLDRGAGFAIAHVRGGGEMGRRWYDDGKMLASDDFHRLRRVRPSPRRGGADPRRHPGCRGRQRRRAADGCGREPRARRRSRASSPASRSSTT